MEQNFTNKTIRELINLKFNVKMFSLMKKQLFSFVMMLAIVVLAGTSAFAQFGVGTQASPQLQFTGASKTFTLSTGIPTGGTRAWLVYDETAGANADASDCTVQTGNGASFTTQWATTAVGTYTIRVTDTTQDGCATVRYFYVLVANFDVDVYACLSNGNRIPVGDAALEGCGQNAAYNAFDNNLVHIGAPVTFNNPDANGTLNNVEGTSPYNQRFVAVEISSNIDLSTINYYWQFDFTIVGDANSDYVQTTTRTAGTTVTGQNVIVDPLAGGGMRTKIVLDLDFFVRWGNDVSFAVDIAQANTRLSDDGTTYNDGNENADNYYGTAADANDPRSNVSATQTFLGSPATSVISSSN